MNHYEGVRAVYGWRATSRWLFLVAAFVVSAVILSMLVGLALTVANAFGVVLIVVAVAGWLTLVGIVLWKVALTVEVTETELRWRAAARRGVAPIDGVCAVRPVVVLAIGGVHAVTFEGRKALWVLVSKGFSRLLDDIKAAAGEIDVRLSGSVGRVDRMPGRDQYRRLEAGDR